MDSLKVADAASQLAADGAESIESLRGDSFSLEVMRFEPGDEDPMHAHGEDEIYQITSGSATINIEGEHVGVRVISFILNQEQSTSSVILMMNLS